jgi:CRP-like cAMP-binding protein
MIAPTASAENNRDLDPSTFLATIGNGVKVSVFLKNEPIFTQGDTADAVFFIQKGKVELTVVSKFGKEATLEILSEGEFFGDGGLAGQPSRMGSATAMMDCELLQIEKRAMMLALQRERAFSDLFVTYLLRRNIRYREALVDQLFDSSEKRLARVLLMLAHFGEEGTHEAVIPEVSQEALADMTWTTRARVTFFMNKFKESDFLAITDNGLQIHSSLLNVVLHD